MYAGISGQTLTGYFFYFGNKIIVLIIKLQTNEFVNN